ncbi:MAG: hypothetical protein QM767_01015 [Anaeromyxobacter sp.]
MGFVPMGGKAARPVGPSPASGAPAAAAASSSTPSPPGSAGPGACAGPWLPAPLPLEAAPWRPPAGAGRGAARAVAARAVEAGAAGEAVGAVRAGAAIPARGAPALPGRCHRPCAASQASPARAAASTAPLTSVTGVGPVPVRSSTTPSRWRRRVGCETLAMFLSRLPYSGGRPPPCSSAPTPVRCVPCWPWPSGWGGPACCSTRR